MDVYNNFSGNGVKVQQFTYHGRDSQQFGFYKQSNDGTYRIVTKSSLGTRNLSVQSASTANGAIIHQYGYGGANDFWWLEKVEYGNGGIYRQVNSQTPNCFGYAMFVDSVNINPIWGGSHSTEDFSGKFEAAINGVAKSCRRIESFGAPISSDEYRVAIRVPNLLDGIHRYHVIYQLSDGTWAGKDDTAPSKHFENKNPSNSPEMWSNDAYAASAGTIYFAVKRW